MNFKYKVVDESNDILDSHYMTDNKKIKEIVTVHIEVQIEKSKYIAKKAKYQEPISQKIEKLFK